MRPVPGVFRAGRKPVAFYDMPTAARMAEAEKPNQSNVSLGQEIEGVLKGLKELRVPHDKVDELGRAVERNRSDRAISRKRL